MGTSAFERQIAVEPGGDGTYRADMSDQWNAPLLPHGGVVTALAIRAMEAELDHPDQALRSVTTVFAAQVASGPLELEAAVLRRGRTMSQATATVRSAGQEAGHTAVAVFGTPRTGFSFTDVTPPAVPPPVRCPSLRDAPPEQLGAFRTPTFWERVESRMALGHLPWDQWTPTTSERAYWYRFDEPPVADDGSWDPLALVALCDTMPGTVAERMGTHMPDAWYAPSADLTVHIVGQARSDWLLAHNRAHHAGDGYGSLELRLWDPETGLVAFGTQMMFFSFPDGVPPSERLVPPPPR